MMLRTPPAIRICTVAQPPADASSSIFFLLSNCFFARVFRSFPSPIRSIRKAQPLVTGSNNSTDSPFSSSVFSWSSSSSNSISDSNDGVSIRIIGSNEGNLVGSEDDDDDDEAVGSVNEGGGLGSGDSVVSGAKGSAGGGGSDNNTGNARGDSSSYQILPLSLLSLVVFIRQHLQGMPLIRMNKWLSDKVFDTGWMLIYELNLVLDCDVAVNCV